MRNGAVNGETRYVVIPKGNICVVCGVTSMANV